MAEPLKHFLGRAVVEAIAADLASAGVPVHDFVERACLGLDALELLDRGRHISRVLRPLLDPDPGRALDQLVASFGPTLGATEANGMAPFRYLPHSNLIAELGVAAPDAGLRACREVTRRFTAEFCLRPILVAHPAPTWAALHRWVDDPDVHVRRLVSEGLRPRLPWATRLRDLQADPRPSLPLLTRLRDDPEPYVRRSVANHLGDIAKDHPELAIEVATAWWADGPPERRALVRHALRHLVKAGEPRAIAMLGFAGVEVEVEGFTAAASARIGGRWEWSFRLRSVGAEEQRLVVDLVVHYRKASGAASPKVFKVANVTLGPGEARAFRGRVALHDMTTRTHHPGRHDVQVQVNGRRLTGASFQLDR